MLSLERYTSWQCFLSREAPRSRLGCSMRTKWPSCRFVVTTSLPYQCILPVRETRTLLSVYVGSAKGMNFASARKGTCSRGWVYPQSSVLGQIKHEAARSFRFVECFLHRRFNVRNWAWHASLLIPSYSIWTFNFISLVKHEYRKVRNINVNQKERETERELFSIKHLHLHSSNTISRDINIMSHIACTNMS